MTVLLLCWFIALDFVLIDEATTLLTLLLAVIRAETALWTLIYSLSH